MKYLKIVLILLALGSLLSVFSLICGCTSENRLTYDLTYTASEGGCIIGECEQKIESGCDAQSVVASAYEGYRFVKWTDGITTATRTETNVNSNITVTAIFEKLSYSLIYESDGNGTIEGETNQTVTYGESTTAVTAIPNDGYRFAEWSDGITTATRQDINVKANQRIVAYFEKQTYTVRYSTDGNGTIVGKTVQEIQPDGLGEEVRAIPYDGYKFVRWSDGNTNPTRREINVNADIQLTAIFEKVDDYVTTFTVSYTTNGNGTIDGETSQTVEYGKSSASVTAIPNEGYRFVEWSDGLKSATRQETNVNSNITITAIFEKQAYTISYSTDGNGTIDGETSQTVAYGKNSASVTAIPNEGYRFVAWTDGLKSATRRETRVNADISVVATFEKIMYTVTYVVSNVYGYISGQGKQTIAYGEDCTVVTAVPGVGCKFVQWSDGNTNPTRQEINVKANISITAIFEKLTFTITYTTDGNGTIDGAATQTLEYGKSSSAVTAVPNEGYKFVQWSDGNTFFRRYDQIYEDKTITAIFEEITLKVTYMVEGGYFMVDGEEFHQTYKQNVKYGGDTAKKLKPILYNSDEDFTFKYVFIKWSDGVETEERQDFNVTEDIFVTAIFGIKLTYSVDGNKGGKLTGNCTQILEEGSDAEKVTAIPDDGYVFDGWSDWSEQMMNPERQDINVVKSTNYVAYFSQIEKTFKYDYGELIGTPLQDKVVINRYKLNEVKFILPEMQGYTFCGWYADKDYKMMLANENGKLMLGYYTFNLDTDTIYARWKIDAAEEILTYKILTVCVEELHVPDLKMYVDDDLRVDVHFTTSAVLRKLYAMYSVKAAQYLNEWFEGKINFEVDTYFTTEILNIDNLTCDPSTSTSGDFAGKYYYRLNHQSLSEISDLIEDDHYYRNIMAIYDFGPKYSVDMRFGAAGNGDWRYAHIFIDCNFYPNYDEVNIFVQRLEREFNTGSESFLNDRFEGLPNIWDNELTVYLHELCHTIQFKCDENIVGDFHKVEYGHQIMEAKNYLLGKAVVDGKIQAIPSSYWTEGGKYMF